MCRAQRLTHQKRESVCGGYVYVCGSTYAYVCECVCTCLIVHACFKMELEKFARTLKTFFK